MIDTHCHLNFEQLAAEIEEVIKRANLVGVDRFIIPGTNLETSASALEMAKMWKTSRAAIGIHPLDAENYLLSEYKQAFLKLYNESPEIVAIGEVGFDFYHHDSPFIRQTQEIVFREMIDLAKKRNVPLIIHTRNAFHEAYTLLKECAAGYPTVIHCFVGDEKEAFKWLDLGCHLSFTGILTYKKSEDLRQVASQIPLDRLMLETDAPFLSPEGFRKETCEPKHVLQVAECLAALKNKSLEEIDQATTQTAEAFFKL